MALTQMQKARFAAQHAIAVASKTDGVVTRKLIDEVLAEKGLPYSGAHRRTVISQVRWIARLSGTPVALTDREEYLMHRAYMRHMDAAHRFTLRDLNDQNGNEDKPFWDALFTTMSGTLRGWKTFFPVELRTWGYREFLRWSSVHEAEVAAWRAENEED